MSHTPDVSSAPINMPTPTPLSVMPAPAEVIALPVCAGIKGEAVGAASSLDAAPLSTRCTALTVSTREAT